MNDMIITADFFRNKAFEFIKQDCEKALKIIDQAASMGQLKVRISDSDINNIDTVYAKLLELNFNVIPDVIPWSMSSAGTVEKVISITVSW